MTVSKGRGQKGRKTGQTKPPAKKPETPPEQPPAAPEKSPELVQPLKREALNIVLSIIDRSDIKGSDAQAILATKQELLRVAGIKPTSQ